MLHRGLGKTLGTIVGTAAFVMALTLCGGSGRGDLPGIPATLRCEFTSQVATLSKSPTMFSTRTMNTSAGLEALTFTEIDPAAQTARLADHAGAATARLVVTSAALVFLDVTEDDNVAVTHVFRGNESGDGSYRAVHARQSLEEGAISSSLSYGLCEPLN